MKKKQIFGVMQKINLLDGIKKDYSNFYLIKSTQMLYTIVRKILEESTHGTNKEYNVYMHWKYM